jgi:hypothetical protein
MNHKTLFRYFGTIEEHVANRRRRKIPSLLFPIRSAFPRRLEMKEIKKQVDREKSSVSIDGRICFCRTYVASHQCHDGYR